LVGTRFQAAVEGRRAAIGPGEDPSAEEKGGPFRPPVVLTVRLLPSLVPDGLIDLLFYRIEVERGRVLHRRKLNGRFRELRHILLNHHEAPKLARIEVVHIAAAEVVYALAAN
jgi:hypothetical protein